MVQIKIIQDRRRSRQDGTYPLFVRVTEQRKSLYLNTGFTLLKEQWDAEASKVLNSHPNANRINASITKRYFEVQKAIIKLDDEERFSFNNLKEELGMESHKSIISVKSFADSLIINMLDQQKIGNAMVYQAAMNALSHFKSTEKIQFIDITIGFLEDYHAHLVRKKVKVNTISNYLRTLRAIYNKAIRTKIVDRRHYPFDDFVIRSEQTAKRAITKKDIYRIEQIDLGGMESMQRAKDLFLLSFYLIGISVVDVAYLTKDHVIDGRIVYRRKKTGKLYSVKLFPKAMLILNRYGQENQKYLLPILSDLIEPDSLESRKVIRQTIKTTNKYLAKISLLVKLEIKLTTYVARHTFATIAKRLGYSNEMIAEALGHEFGNKTTAIYLDSFDKKEIDNMQGSVVGE